MSLHKDYPRTINYLRYLAVVCTVLLLLQVTGLWAWLT